MNLKEITSVTLKKSEVVYKLKKGDIVLFRRQQHETLNKLVKYFNAKAYISNSTVSTVRKIEL